MKILDQVITNLYVLKRKELNLGVKQISDYLDVDESFIRQIESYQKKLNIYHLYLLSVLFKCDISELFPNEINISKLSNNNNVKLDQIFIDLKSKGGKDE